MFCSQSCWSASIVGAGNPKWRGGRLISGGYVYVRSPDHPNRTKLGYVLEHRLVMEKHIGRLLLPTEAVHHINGNTFDNRLENLELCESNGKHSVEHHVFRDAIGRFASS